MQSLPRRVLATVRRRWFLDRKLEFWLGEIDPSWSLSERRARVVEILDETPDTRTFVLATGARWPGHRAGQFVPIGVEIDGVRVRRCYSISSGGSEPGAGHIAITVRRVEHGRVSTWLHTSLVVGDVVELGDPAGDFTARHGDRLLLVAGGSGITPIMAIVRDLAAAGALRDVVVIHCARTREDAIFATELAELARINPTLRLVTRYAEPRLDAASVRALVPDLARRETFVCGPAGLIEVVTEAGVPERLHVERFVAAPLPRRAATAPVAVELVRSGRHVVAAGSGPLLVQLERAGVTPPAGCRMGICGTCRCTVQRGTVENLLTGEVSSEPDNEIRLCISSARSDLELAL
jgi:ferredoxin-NADP reductase